MTARHCIAVLISLLVMAGLFTQASAGTSAANATNPAAFSPWKLKTVDSNTYANHVSVAHGGSSQYPLIILQMATLSGGMCTPISGSPRSAWPATAAPPIPGCACPSPIPEPPRRPVAWLCINLPVHLRSTGWSMSTYPTGLP